MRLLELMRARSFRLALVYMGLFGVSISLLLAFIYLIAGNRVKSHVDEFVTSETDLFVADYNVGGRSGVIELMRARDVSDRSNHWIYLYVDRDGRYLAGDQRTWPRANKNPDGFFDLPATTANSGKVRARAVRFADGSKLLVGLNDYEVIELRAALTRAMVIGLVAMFLLALIGGLLVTLASLRHLESINRVTREIMGGELSRRVPVHAVGDEFDQLGRNINAMLDRIGELMQTVQGVTDNIAHDLRLPLARMRTRLESAQRDDLDREALQASLDRAIDELDSILQTFGSMLRITHVESGSLRESFTPVDLSAITHDAEQLCEPLAWAASQHLSSTLSPDLRVLGNRDLLFQAISNLIDNAIKHSPAGTLIHVSLRRHGPVIECTVVDNGPGIPAEDRQKVFQRMVRLDPSRSTPGNGLGLSLVRAVALLHDGQCEIEDNEPGTRAILRLPALKQRPG